MLDSQEMTLDISQSIEIDAAMGDAYNAMIRRLSVDNSTPDNKPMPMVLEEWPGGRWFRDLGDGNGHLWGFVQVIKPPNLIELNGPMFMSFAATNHVQIRLTSITGGTELKLRHRAIGVIEDDLREGLTHGWEAMLYSVKHNCEQD